MFDIFMSENLYGVTLHNLGAAFPLNPPEESIILPMTTILAGIPILLPRDICQIQNALDIAPGQLTLNTFRTLVGMLALLKLFGYQALTLERF